MVGTESLSAQDNVGGIWVLVLWIIWAAGGNAVPGTTSLVRSYSKLEKMHKKDSSQCKIN